MGEELFIADMVDQKDVISNDDETLISMAGVLKMAAGAAFHSPNSIQRVRSEKMMGDLLRLATQKGFCKTDMLKTAFANSYPPSSTARLLADEAMAPVNMEDLLQLGIFRQWHHPDRSTGPVLIRTASPQKGKPQGGGTPWGQCRKPTRLKVRYQHGKS